MALANPVKESMDLGTPTKPARRWITLLKRILWRSW